MAVPNSEAVQWLPSGSTSAESRSSRIGPIILEVKQTGERSAGNPHAAFDEAGAGNVAEVAIRVIIKSSAWAALSVAGISIIFVQIRDCTQNGVQEKERTEQTDARTTSRIPPSDAVFRTAGCKSPDDARLRRARHEFARGASPVPDDGLWRRCQPGDQAGRWLQERRADRLATARGLRRGVCGALNARLPTARASLRRSAWRPSGSAANPSFALNLTNTKLRLRPFHLVVRETEFCGLATPKASAISSPP